VSAGDAEAHDRRTGTGDDAMKTLHSDNFFKQGVNGGSLQWARDYERREIYQKELVEHYTKQVREALVYTWRMITCVFWCACYAIHYRVLRFLSPRSAMTYRAINAFRATWQRHYSFTAEYARAHPDELTEYGRLTMIVLPALLDDILRELKAQNRD
jgi:hypothetical protein